MVRGNLSEEVFCAVLTISGASVQAGPPHGSAKAEIQ
jgi:hypothetical protein